VTQTVGLWHFCLGVRYHSGSLGVRDSFPDNKDVAAKKDECEQF
jgi:hypothetical protein